MALIDPAQWGLCHLAGRVIEKMRWDKGGEHAVLTAQEKSKRGVLEVWRGKFDTEVYRVR